MHAYTVVAVVFPSHMHTLRPNDSLPGPTSAGLCAFKSGHVRYSLQLQSRPLQLVAVVTGSPVYTLRCTRHITHQ